MKALNIEIKARCHDLDYARSQLKQHNARYEGKDHQVDTYFKVPHGRLKLRQGNIENALIHYKRDNQQGPKSSEVELYKTKAGGQELFSLLSGALGILVTVDKFREIYFIQNVKFHLDTVAGLGTFVEIEAIDEHGVRSAKELTQQCQYYIKLLSINESDLISNSYSDLLHPAQNPQ